MYINIDYPLCLYYTIPPVITSVPALYLPSLRNLIKCLSFDCEYERGVDCVMGAFIK